MCFKLWMAQRAAYHQAQLRAVQQDGRAASTVSREKAEEPDSSLGYRKSQELSKSSQLATVVFKSKAAFWLPGSGWIALLHPSVSSVQGEQGRESVLLHPSLREHYPSSSHSGGLFSPFLPRH